MLDTSSIEKFMKSINPWESLRLSLNSRWLVWSCGEWVVYKRGWHQQPAIAYSGDDLEEALSWLAEDNLGDDEE